MSSSASSARTRILRGSDRAVYADDSIQEILDSGFICQVGYVEGGEARVLPTAYIRIDDGVYLHGHLKNAMMNALLDGQTACISVTLLDGLVLARSGFNHSVNFRSVTLFGKAQPVEENKEQILDRFIDRLVPGRTESLRKATPQELNATMVVRVPIDEAVAKVRIGPPKDKEEDYAGDTWAGVIRLDTIMGDIERCPRLKDSVHTPEHVLDFLAQGRLFD